MRFIAAILCSSPVAFALPSIISTITDTPAGELLADPSWLGVMLGLWAFAAALLMTFAPLPRGAQ